MDVDEPEFISTHEPVQERIVRFSTCQQLGHFRKTSLLCRQNSNRAHQTINQAKQTQILPSRHGLGRMTTMCSECKAFMWVEERSESRLHTGSFQFCSGLGNKKRHQFTLNLDLYPTYYAKMIKETAILNKSYGLTTMP